MISQAELEILERQLNRKPRSIIEISYKSANQTPVVIKTFPKLEDGTPFPTLYYLTEPKISSIVGTLEANGLMEIFNAILLKDQETLKQYENAYNSYLAERNSLYDLGTNFAGGGMPERVKCLHFQVAHSLAKGYGLNPIGDETVAILKNNEKIKNHLPEAWPVNTIDWSF